MADTAPKPTLHQWHRDTFLKRTEVDLVAPSYKAMFGNVVPEESNKATFGTARAAVVQRTLNGMSPAEWNQVLTAFDASDEGKALVAKYAAAAKNATGDDAKNTTADVPPHIRREHAELWAAHHLHETDDESLVPASELALQSLLQVHAHPDKLQGHKARLLAHAASVVSPPPAVAVKAPDPGTGK